MLREGVDHGEIKLEKIGDADNVANMYTKPVTRSTMDHYMSYTHGHRPAHDKTGAKKDQLTYNLPTWR